MGKKIRATSLNCTLKVGEFDGMQIHNFTKAVLKKPPGKCCLSQQVSRRTDGGRRCAHIGGSLGKTQGMNSEVAAPRSRVRDVGKRLEQRARAERSGHGSAGRGPPKGACRAVTTIAINAHDPSGVDAPCNLNSSVSTILCDSRNSPAGSEVPLLPFQWKGC